jgi:hypothetical protein
MLVSHVNTYYYTRKQKNFYIFLKEKTKGKGEKAALKNGGWEKPLKMLCFSAGNKCFCAVYTNLQN